VNTTPVPATRRFTAAEVWVHATFGALVGVGIVTAALLYVDPLSVLVGRRDVVADVHLWAGLLVPVPLAVGLLSGALRADLHRLDTYDEADRRWLRSRDRRRLPVDRFNAGQKLNAAFTLGAVLVLLGTGVVMAGLVVNAPDDLRTGATFVHDWAAFGLTVAVVGHLYFVRRYGRGDATAPRGGG
jgi:formate dehydrogenase subunit gamma